MPSYSITGPSGTGKSTVGRVLHQRGFRVIETDFEDGLSAWFNNASGKKVTEMPAQPYTQEWVDAHSWLWDKARINELLNTAGEEPVFFCGGAYNEREFFGSFKMRFGLWVNEQSLVKRLQEREPERWQDGSVELQKQIDWSKRFKDYAQQTGAIVIDSSVSPDTIADSILMYIQ